MMEDVISRLWEFMENEARSCSMDFGCVTPEYVNRMWGVKRDNQGGSVKLKEV